MHDKKSIYSLNKQDPDAIVYTDADKQRFETYLAGQLAKIKIDNKDEVFLRERILTMYANPVKNKLRIND